MILLDSDHVSVLKYSGSARRDRLIAKMALVSDDDVGIPVAVVEEGLRGWLASVAKERDVARQVNAYDELIDLIALYNEYEIAPFDDAAAAHFKSQRAAKSTVKTMDLKIACIALANDALLLTANRRDFEKVPGLRFENWIDPPPVP